MVALPPPERCREILDQLGYGDTSKVFVAFLLTDEQCGLLQRAAQATDKIDGELIETLCRKALGESE